MKKKKRAVNKTIYIIFVVVSVTLIASVVLFAVFLFLSTPKSQKIPYDAFRYNDNYIFTDENGNSEKVNLPYKGNVTSGNVASVSTVLPADLKDNYVLCFPSSCETLVYIDGELRADLTIDNASFLSKYPIVKTMYFFVDIGASDSGKTLTIEKGEHVEGQGIASFKSVTIGDSLGIYKLFTDSGRVAYVSLFILAVASLFIIAIGLILRVVHKQPMTYISLGIAVFIGSCWLIFDNINFQIIFGKDTIDGVLSFLFIMLIPFPLIYYMNTVQKYRYQKVYIALAIIALANFSLFSILNFSNTIGFYESMLPMNLVLFAIIVVPFVIMVRDIFIKKIGEYPIVAAGMFGFLAFGIAEIYVVNFVNSLYAGRCITPGMYYLLFMALLHGFNEFVRVSKEKELATNASRQKSQFLANMSHEIRTPINSIVGMDEMILRESKDVSIKNYASQIKRSGKILLELINDVLDISKIEAGMLHIVEEPYDVVDSLKDTILMLKERARTKGLKVYLNIDENIPSRLEGDYLHINQILINLISNAVKYTIDGSVTFSVKLNSINDEECTLEMIVEDTGMGIKPADMDKLFSKFVRVDYDNTKTIEGTGLGLNIAKNLVDAMNGEIFVESVYGKGSKFIVMLDQKIVDDTPIGPIDTEMNDYKLSEEIGRTFIAPKANVLAVDDKNENLVVIRELLKRTLVTLDLVSSGKEAIFKCRQNRYDLIFMDHMMPEPDGIDSFNIIRNDNIGLNRETPVVVLTANAVAGMREKYLGLGFCDYLTKPIEVDKIESCMVRFLPPDYIKFIDDKNYDDVDLSANSDISAMEEALKGITVMDYDKTLERFAGKKDVVKKVLEVIVKESRTNAQNARDFVAMNDFDSYKNEAHAIKGVMATIFAEDLKERAKAHEYAARDGKYEFIRNDYINFLNNYEKLMEQIKECLDLDVPKEDLSKAKEMLSNEELLSKLNQIKNAIDDYEYNNAIEAFDELKGYFITDDIKAEINKAAQKILDFDYDESADIIEGLIRKIANF